MINEKNGITLIALIITIIVLLILAGISISNIVGENGILEKAKSSSEKYETSKEEEEKGLDELYSTLMIATNDSAQVTISVEDLKTLIDKRVEEKLNLELETLVNEKLADIDMLKDCKAGSVTFSGLQYHISDSKNVVFDVPYENADYVVFISRNSGGAFWAETSFTAKNKTAEGFSINAYNTENGTSGDLTVSWIAIPLE